MPILPHVVLASGAVVAVSLAVAAALAMYELPELREYADDIRRRLALALQPTGQTFEPAHREPRFNRPEDAAGFMESRRGAGAEPGVDADDETRRRQREELLYWNRLLLEKQDMEKAEEETTGEMAGLPHESVEQGTYVFNSGSDVRDSKAGLRHRREGARGVDASLYANPFADEHQIANDEVAEMGVAYLTPAGDEAMSDIYSATTRDPDDVRSATLAPSSALIDVASNSGPWRAGESPSAGTVGPEPGQNEHMSSGQEDGNEAYASIQAWAHDSSRIFYSPLPVTPAAPMSEPELVSQGQLTPTDSDSLVGSGEDIANEAQSSRAGETGRLYDVVSESEGMLTPASWSDIGSVISESDAHGNVHA